MFFKNWFKKIRLKKLEIELSVAKSFLPSSPDTIPSGADISLLRQLGENIAYWRGEVKRLEVEIQKLRLSFLPQPPRLNKVLLPSIITRVK